MKIRTILVMFITLFFLSSCAQKQYMKQNSALIVFKTPTFKYADMGFIYENSDEIKVEIYGSGEALMTLTISETSVCMSVLECMNKESFNKKVLSGMYPKDVLENIFRGKPILNSENLKKNRNGFTQNIVSPHKYNIEYTLLNNQMIFRDTINNILIKVKRIE